MDPDSVTPDIHFFIGKGGVGKSTTSALTALCLSGAGCKTLLVSMDPAHNQRDLFETRFSERPTPVTPTLSVKEVDTEFWIARYLKETRQAIQRAYIYESAFNLQKHFKVIQFSPGLEEYALLLAFEDVLRRGADRDAIIFDMAPTALSLRFFSLPEVSLVWLRELLSLRELICRKKAIISTIRLGACQLEQDRVKTKLEALSERHSRLQACFAGDRTHVHLVMNADRLSLSEALRIRKRLADLSMAVDRVVVNKVTPDDGAEALVAPLAGERIAYLPLADAPLVGLSSLQAYAARQQATLHDFMPSRMRNDGPLRGAAVAN